MSTTHYMVYARSTGVILATVQADSEAEALRRALDANGADPDEPPDDELVAADVAGMTGEERAQALEHLVWRRG